MAPPYDVVVVGSYFCDMVFTGLPELPQLGRDIFSREFDIVPGGTFYTVMTLHRLHVKAGWLGHLGNDFFSRFIMEAAAAEGIDTQLFQVHNRPIRRVAAAFSFEQDRGFVSYADAVDEPLPPTLLEDCQPRCVVLHGLHYLKHVHTLRPLKTRFSFTIFLDCQDTALTLASPGLADTLGGVDIFAPNETEALHLTGEPTVERALARLAEIVPLVVIKCGPKGAIAQRGGTVVQVPAIAVDVVDTTGAGDCFNAGFVFGLLRGDPLDMCLRYANITGGRSTTAPGGQAVPTMATVLDIAQHYQQYSK